MNKATAFLAAGGALLALTAFNKKISADALNFYPDRVGAELEGVTPIINLRLGIQNPAPQGFTLKSFVGNLYANGYTIGNVSSFEQVLIAPHNVSYINLKIRVSLVGMAADLYNSIVNKTGATQEVKLVGNTDVDGILLPVSISYKIL